MIQLTFGFGAVEGELWRLVFVMTRIGAALLAAPFFGAAAVPMQLRVAMEELLAASPNGFELAGDITMSRWPEIGPLVVPLRFL